MITSNSSGFWKRERYRNELAKALAGRANLPFEVEPEFLEQTLSGGDI